MHFRTSNVLLDENFTAKVADFGHSRLTAGNGAGPSSTIDCFLDPEMSMNMINGASEKCDVYAFGVFLLELISGQEAISKAMSESGMNLVEEAKRCCNISSFMDKVLREKAVHVIQPMMEIALQCIDTGARRPTMSWVARELELIQERKMSHHNSPSGLGNETAVVTLGSDLFK
ncbi:Wall-associated receptor kinase 4 [Acorus gramineus]|uniref:non-specific serine/threonine protein kinase n=1 Tax=Acorus gramineus TaxID=55184 RepID=A0AAV9AP30_ACOGR|nr:Wall-associated receptor kinase 4 [Acorus gramineus]